MGKTQLETNKDVLKKWADAQNCDPVAALVVATGLSIQTARKILNGTVPNAGTRRLVSLCLHIPENTLWRPKAA